MNDLFNTYWSSKQGGGESSSVIQMSRSVEGPAPHGVSLENGILLLSAWIGNDPLQKTLFDDLCDFARRILGENQPNDDSFEKDFRAKMNERVASADDETPTADVAEDADDRDRTSPLANSIPDVHQVLIKLVSLKDVPRESLAGLIAPFVFWRDKSIRVVAPTYPVDVVHADGSHYFAMDMEVVDGFSAIASGNDKLTVALVRFGSLKRLLDQGNMAFDANVRGWLGYGSVTNARLKRMFADVAAGKEDPKMFPFYHNGVSICCQGMQPRSHNNFHLVHPQVINGQQTLCGWRDVFNGLEDAETDARSRLESLLVMVRLVQAGNIETLDKITFANNRQNAVSAVDLRSNEPCLIEIEKVFSDKFPFARKRGIARHNGLDSRRIFQLWKHIADESIGEEDFFDSRERFDSLFKSLANTLTNNPHRLNRLTGLWQVSKVSAGKDKRRAVADLLVHLGVDGKTVGKDVASDGDNPTVQRMLVYALWPRIHQGILHILLGNNEWMGSNSNKIIHSFTPQQKRRTKLWTPSIDLLKLIDPRLDNPNVRVNLLPSDLITGFMKRYRDWIAVENIDVNDDELDDLFSMFVEEKVSLAMMLKCMNTERRDLVSGL